MRADFPVVLDACVLANARVCDLFLRLAESPRLYLPFWSDKILDETQRTHTKQLNWPVRISESWREAVTQSFPDSCAQNHDHCVSPQSVDEKDRHVVQAAIKCGAEIIVTYNLKDFPTVELEKINIRARHPSEFLLTLFSIEPLLVARRLNEISEVKGERFLETLKKLRTHVPAFVDHFATAAGISIEETAD